MKRMLFVSLLLCLGIAIATVLANKNTETSLMGVGNSGIIKTAYSAESTSKPLPEKSIVDQDAPYMEACAREGLSESACVGRLIWFKATAGNDRFHTYTFQQRIGVMIDWFRVLRSDQRDDRFKAWGVINDPACCKPGDPDCPAKSLDETYGFDWCPGDDVLLKYVGKSGYVDPACGLKDTPLDPNDPHTKGGKEDQRHSSCDLKFGTSTGALGIRKFPNPRFNPERWKEANGRMASWEGFRAGKFQQTHIPSDERVNKLADPSREPPFLIGTSCGSCHIAFDPKNPPVDSAKPKWENIKGLIGNQYTRMSEILGSGMSRNSLEWQMFTHARPGTTDTSAISHDGVNNPGTINAIINLSQRPTFDNEQINKWRKVNSCGTEKNESKCWCEPGRDGKCWEKNLKTENGIHHILKGGEDSIGALEAIQRVYFNIGSCSEQCWVNHFTDLRQVDPQQRAFGQTPFNIGQCRRDCPNFRAVEDRLSNILDFFMSAESDATDLDQARNHERKAKDSSAKDYTRTDLVTDLEKEFGKDAVKRGQTVFAENCARCHSSIPEKVGVPFKDRDFYALAEEHPRKVRKDFLGNEQATPATEVGTFRCRALHSNHMAGHLYQEYASETLRGRKPDPNIPEREDLKNGGRGYYRNISLLNVWATAPLMHNNAIGPELCGKPNNKDNDFFRSRYVDATGKLLEKQPACFAYDPSIEGRFNLYKQSMHELLYPKNRGIKVSLTDQDILIDLGLRSWKGNQEVPLFGTGQVKIPKGTPVGLIGGMMYKDFVGDLYLAKRDPSKLEAKGKKENAAALQGIADNLLKDPTKFVDVLKDNRDFINKNYNTCMASVENEGHRFGEDLSDADKNALIAFLATM